MKTETERVQAAKLLDKESILPAELKEKLSNGARKLYTSLWFLSFTRDSKSLFIDSRDLSQRSHVGLNYLPTITTELVDAGLITTSTQRHGSIYRLIQIAQCANTLDNRP